MVKGKANEIKVETSAVCDAAAECPPGENMCVAGALKGFCSVSCTAELGTGVVILLFCLTVFAAYCLFGACYNKERRGTCAPPHQEMWMRCLSWEVCRGNGNNDSRSDAPFRSGVASASAGDAFRKGAEHPDHRKSTYGAL